MYETTENTWRERDSVFTSSMTNRALSIPSIVFFFLFHMLVRIVLSTSPFKTGVTKRSEKSGITESVRTKAYRKFLFYSQISRVDLIS